jgi:trk system potassium uptake protein TrkA
MKQFAVIGIGRFGYSVVRALVEQGYQVLAIDDDEEAIKEVEDIATQAAVLDSTDERALRAVGITDVDVAVVAIGRDKEASILTTLLLKEIGIREVVAKATSPLHGKVLDKIGATRVVYPEGDMGERLANTLVSPSILETIELSKDYGIFEITVDSKYVGQTLGESKLRSSHELNVIAIKRRNEESNDHTIDISPLADDILREGDILVVIGQTENLEHFKDILKG